MSVDSVLIVAIPATSGVILALFLLRRHTSGKARVVTRASATGILDSLAPLGYLLLGSAALMHLLALGGKTVLLLVGRHPSEKPSKRAVALALGAGALAFVSLALEVGNPLFSAVGYLQYAAFGLSLVLSASLVPTRRHFAQYSRAFLMVPGSVAMLHLSSILTGQAQNHFGRYLYVGGQHPNLGGEIAAATAFLAACFLGLRWFLLAAGPLAASAITMQARAAAACIVLLIVVRVLWVRAPQSRIVGPAVAVAFVVTIGLLGGSQSDFYRYIADEVLLADDAYRGLDSGFTGRIDPWRESLRAFKVSPLVGQGIGYVAGEIGAHNAFLYGLSRHGLLSLLIWVPLALGLSSLWQHDRRQFLLVSSTAVLFLFNARFLNLNPFPFVIYLALVVDWSVPIQADLEPRERYTHGPTGPSAIHVNGVGEIPAAK